MKAWRGDLRNLVNLRLGYVKSSMRGMKKNGAHMPFPHNVTLHIMQQIATGVETLHYLEMIHKDLKVSNILCPQLTKCGLHAIKLTCSRNFPMEIVFACDRFVVAIGDYESIDGVVGTAILESAWSAERLEREQAIHVFTSRGCVRFRDGMLWATLWSRSFWRPSLDRLWIGIVRQKTRAA